MIENTNYYWNLIKRSQAGQRRSFEELTGFYHKTVFLHALRMTGDLSSAEIITSDVFIRAWEHIKFLNENSPFNLWLNGLTISLTSAFYQKKRKDTKKAPALKPQTTNEYDEKFLTLSARERIVLILHDLEGYSISDCQIMLGEGKENILKLDLENARKQFLDNETIRLLNTYQPEEWRKLTQDFEFWFKEISDENQLNDNLRALKKYRDLLDGFLSSNTPSESVLNGLKAKFIEESKIVAESERKKEAERRNTDLNNSNLLKISTDQNVIFSSPKDASDKLTEEVAAIFSNPDDAKEQYSKKLKIAKKQKAFAKNLGYVLGALNLIVLYFIISNITESVNWKQKTSNDISIQSANFLTTELSVGDIIKTGHSNNLDIVIQSIGTISLNPDTEIKLLNRDKDNNELELLDGDLRIKTDTYYNRFSIFAGNYKIIDYGSSTSINFIQKNNDLNIKVNKGSVTLSKGKIILPIVENYFYKSENRIPFHQDASPMFISNVLDLKFPIEISANLNNIINMNERKDLVTLWVLLSQSNRAASKKIFDKIMYYITPAEGIDEEAILRKDLSTQKKLLYEIEWQL